MKKNIVIYQNESQEIFFTDKISLNELVRKGDVIVWRNLRLEVRQIERNFDIIK